VKRALVLSGGGAHGAYQVGVLKRLIHEKGNTYDVIAGVSVGSINAVQIAQYAPSEQRDAAKMLEVFWRGIKGNDSIYKSWLWGQVESLWRGGMYNTAPLEALLRKNVNPERLKKSGVKLRVGCVALGKGTYRYVTEHEDGIIDWVMASSSYPGAFPPRKIGDELWTDGGVRDVTPISDVLDEKPDFIDVVLTSTKEGSPGTENLALMSNVIFVGLRCASLLSDEVWVNDLKLIPEEWKSKIKIYAPKEPLPYTSLDFNPQRLADAIDLGYRDAE